jgi:hypothetical protein
MLARHGWSTRNFGVYVFIEGYAESIVLHPGDRTFDPADIADVNLKGRAAPNADGPFAHHPAG